MLALSWIAAFAACLGYGVASVLQSGAAKRTGHLVGVGGVAAIMLQLPYLAGLAADAIAFVANVVALQRLPLFLVQSIMTASVGVTAVIAALRGAVLRARDWVALGVLVGGLVLLSITATSDRAVGIPLAGRYLIFGSLVLPGLLGLIGLRSRGRRSWVLLAAAAGLAFSAVAVSSRAVSADRIDPHLLADPLLWTILVQGALALVFFALALQRGPVTSITAVTFMLEMLVPSLIGVLAFGDQVRPGFAPLALLGFALAVAGTATLARYAE